jgi:hypothetical protein
MGLDASLQQSNLLLQDCMVGAAFSRAYPLKLKKG